MVLGYVHSMIKALIDILQVRKFQQDEIMLIKSEVFGRVITPSLLFWGCGQEAWAEANWKLLHSQLFLLNEEPNFPEEMIPSVSKVTIAKGSLHHP